MTWPRSTRLLRILDRDLGRDDFGLSRRHVQHELVVVGLVDPGVAEQFLATFELAARVDELGLGRLPLRHGLVEAIAGRPRIDADQQRATLHRIAGIGPELEDLARGLRLDLDGAHGLDHATGFDRQHERTVLGLRGLVLARLGNLASGAAGAQDQHRQ